MVRADTLRTKREIARTFFAQGSPRVLTAAVAAVLAGRVVAGRWSWVDAVIVVLTVAATGIVEWVLHRGLLHAPEDAWTSRRLGTGAGHRRHHLDPPDLEWLLLHRADAIVFCLLIAVASIAWTVPALLVLGTLVGGVGLLGPVLTAVLVAYLALAHYEWTHLLEHTRYRPRTRYYRRMARVHRLHHFRNERYWLGITSTTGDRLMSTLPAEAADVPISETARTLA
jgi:hypothetical protein